MKPLIIFYSRTGTTRKVAEKLKELLDAEIEEVIDLRDRSGPIGYVKAGQEATLQKLTKIKPTAKDPKKYSLVILGTPVWAFTMCSAIRTYITQNKQSLKNVAFFCTMQGSGSDRTFRHMRELTAKQPVATLTLLTKEVNQGLGKEKIERFIQDINNNSYTAPQKSL